MERVRVFSVMEKRGECTGGERSVFYFLMNNKHSLEGHWRFVSFDAWLHHFPCINLLVSKVLSLYRIFLLVLAMI